MSAGNPDRKIYVYVGFSALTYSEVFLSGVGVDGVRGIFLFFCFSSLFCFSLFFFAFLSFFFVFICFSSLLFAFLRFFVILRFSLILSEEKGKQLQFTAKMGNFTPTPSVPTPCKASRT